MAKVKLISHFHSNSLGLLLLQNYDRPTFVKGGGHGYAATWTETEEGTKWTNNSSSLVPLENTSDSSLDELLVLCYCGCCCCQLRPAAALAWAEAVEAAEAAALEAGEIGSPTPPPKSGMLEVTSEAVGGDGQPFVLVWQPLLRSVFGIYEATIKQSTLNIMAHLTRSAYPV